MGFFDDLTHSVASAFDWAGSSLRRITAIFFILFALGVVAGLKVATSTTPNMPEIAILAPLVLAGLAYFSTGMAVILFILVVFFLFFFI